MKEDFNPLPPHGGRRPPICNIFSDPVFQSTPSTRRETYWISVTLLESFSFQSTPSTRRETRRRIAAVGRTGISIHSLHTEGDQSDTHHQKQALYFNPLPPHGGRPHRQRRRRQREGISIHSLHTEGDTGRG